MKDYLHLLRPYSWIKNFFIFAPLFFARQFLDPSKFQAVAFAFIAFCLTASCIYILNDILDVEHDRLHSNKKNRPLVSGKISLKHAHIFLGILGFLDAIFIFFFVPHIYPLILLYTVLNIAYSLYLKHVAVVDVLLVSSFYLIRIMVGGIAAQVLVSDWLLLCTIFISLFLIIAKRIAELQQKNQRKVLLSYTSEFLTALLIISATLSVISYSLYTVLVLNSQLAVCSIFFVLMGIMKYLLITFTSDKSEYPEKTVIMNPTIIVSIIGWVVFMYFIFY